MNISIAASKITQVILAALICMGCGVSSAPGSSSDADASIRGKRSPDESDFIKTVRASNMLYYIVWLLFEVQWWGNQTLCTSNQLQEIVKALTVIYNDLYNKRPIDIDTSSQEISCKFLKNLLNLIMTDPSRIRKLEFLRHTINAMNYNISHANRSKYKSVKSYITDIAGLSAELNTESTQDGKDNKLHTKLSKKHYYQNSVNAVGIKQKMQNIFTITDDKKQTVQECSEAYWLLRGFNDRIGRSDLISQIPLSTSEKAPAALVAPLGASASRERAGALSSGSEGAQLQTAPQGSKTKLPSIPEDGSSTESPRSTRSSVSAGAAGAAAGQVAEQPPLPPPAGESEESAESESSPAASGAPENSYNLKPSMHNNMRPITTRPTSDAGAASPASLPGSPPAGSGSGLGLAGVKTDLMNIDVAEAIIRLNNSQQPLSDIDTESLLSLMGNLDKLQIEKIDVNRLACIIVYMFEQHYQSSDQVQVDKIKTFVHLALEHHTDIAKAYIISTIGVKISSDSRSAVNNTKMQLFAQNLFDHDQLNILNSATKMSDEMKTYLRSNEFYTQEINNIQYIMLDALSPEDEKDAIKKMSKEVAYGLNSESLLRTKLKQADFGNIDVEILAGLIVNLCKYRSSLQNQLSNETTKIYDAKIKVLLLRILSTIQRRNEIVDLCNTELKDSPAALEVLKSYTNPDYVDPNTNFKI